jgi:hypothetical protein
MKKLIFFLIIFNSSISFSQKSINYELKNKLDTIHIYDQKYRLLSHAFLFQNKKDSVQRLLKIPEDNVLRYLDSLTKYYDSLNLYKIELIISNYGYPGKTLVGEPTNSTVWYVIQHSAPEIRNKYLSLIEKAAEEKEIPYRQYAMMLDRYLTDNKKEQIYGSQLTSVNFMQNKNQNKVQFVVWPIKNHKYVNLRRKKAGFKDTIEEYCKLFNIKYKHFTLRQMKSLSY